MRPYSLFTPYLIPLLVCAACTSNTAPTLPRHIENANKVLPRGVRAIALDDAVMALIGGGQWGGPDDLSAIVLALYDHPGR